jgi:hypothetical protein
VAYAAVVVQVLKRGDTKKYFAKLLCIGDDCDLALMVRPCTFNYLYMYIT